MFSRSEVALALTKKAASYFDKRLSRLNDNRSVLELFDSADNHSVDKVTGAEMWHWNHTNWNPKMFDNCKIVEGIIHDLPVEEYKFFRLGDYMDDHEDWGHFYNNPFNLGVHRYIDYNA